jgi:FkbM family methyltransferase
MHALAQTIPSKLRERLLFGGVHRQSLVQRAIGGRALASIRLRDSLRFQCWTDEKYFWLGDDFDADLLPAIKEVAAGMDTVYDIGAHAGFYAMLFAESASQVFAFEPDEDNCRRLRFNCAQLPNISIQPYALSDRAGMLHLEQCGSMSHIVETGGLSVRCTTLDECQLPPPNLIKLDVEGHGARVLAGGTHTIGRYRPRIVMEVHNGEELEALESLTAYRVERFESAARFPYHILALGR